MDWTKHKAEVNKESRAFIDGMWAKKRRLDMQRLLRPDPPEPPEQVRLKRLQRAVGVCGNVQEISLYVFGQVVPMIELERNCLTPLSGDTVHTPIGEGTYVRAQWGAQWGGGVRLFGVEYRATVKWNGRWMVDEIFGYNVPVGTIVASGLSEGVVQSTLDDWYVVRLASGCVSCKLKLVSRGRWGIACTRAIQEPSPVPQAKSPLVYIAREMYKNGVDTQGSSR